MNNHNARLTKLEQNAARRNGPTQVFDEVNGALVSAKTGQPVTVDQVNAMRVPTLIIRSFDGPHVEGLRVGQTINLSWGPDELGEAIERNERQRS